MSRENKADIFSDDIDLKCLFDIINPENNLVLADDMMLSAADGTILRVSETYEQNFGFAHGSIVGKSAFDLEADGTFSPCITARVIRERSKVITTQTINRTHKNVMTVGIPLFDSRGTLKYAVCFNTVSMEQINTILRNYHDLQESVEQYTAELAELRTRATATGKLVFRSPAMQRLWTLMQNTANTKANILITGETGVGKSAVAKTIHKMSGRADGPFIEVNCAVLHENLIESELFGYEKGAFTGASSAGKIGKIELANHGTLFLDEIGDLDMVSQVKLLRVLQDHTFESLGDSRPKQVDTRIICATNRNLPQMVQQGEFREDLFYRINLITVQMPALRERREDIPLLVEYFARQQARQNGLEPVEISAEAMEYLSRLPYPGNVRELKNFVERTILVSQQPHLTEVDFKNQYVEIAAKTGVHDTSVHSLEEIEKQMILRALELYGGNLSKVATALGLSRQAVYRRLEKYAIRPPE